MASIKVLALKDEWGGIARLFFKQVNHPAQVSIADSEQSVIQQIQKEHFDLLFLDQGGRNTEILERLHPIIETTGTLTLMIAHKSSPSGFVRTPIPPGDAHAYIPSPFGPKEFYEWVSKLLEGASTQRFPGDEGYKRRECEELGVAFERPDFWMARSPSRSRKDAFQRFYTDAIGPKNRHWGVHSKIVVSMYRPFEPGTSLETKGMMAHEFEEGKENIQQITLWREVWVCGLGGEQAEYTWSAERFLETSGDRGRTILTIVRKGERIYILSLAAAEEGFDDFRPAYAHFLETFEFLD